jgi:pSer/pThr/pTyr-binding forkhead associated (FHA) protein
MKCKDIMSQNPDEPNTKLLKPVANSEPMPDRGPRPPTGQLRPPWRLLLQMEGDNRTTVGLEVSERIVVGRGEGANGHEIGLDMTAYGGATNGVSRVHAAFSHEKGSIYLEDLGSTNGTRINGFQMTPNKPYRLRDGDEVEFGRARVVVRFVRPSPT